MEETGFEIEDNKQTREIKQSLGTAYNSPSILSTLCIFKNQNMFQVKLDLLKQFCQANSNEFQL